MTLIKDGNDPYKFVIDLDRACNQNCMFCFKQDHDKNYHPPFRKLKKKIDEQVKQGKVIADVFGGEPTVYKHFFKTLKYLEKNDLEISIATNFVMFSNDRFWEKFQEWNDKYQPRIHHIRTSLHGHTPEIHDHYTQTAGSFDRMMKGLDRIKTTGIKIIVNTVLLPRNYQHLQSMFDLIYNKGIRSFKYGLVSTYPEPIKEDVLVNIKDINRFLVFAIKTGLDLNCEMVIEKAPLCIAPMYRNNFQYDKPRHFGEICSNCILYEKCVGVSTQYFERFGEDGFAYLQPN